MNNTFAYEVQDSQLNISSMLQNTAQNVYILKTQHESSMLSAEKSKQEVLITHQVKANPELTNRVNYGEGIKIVRLFNTKLVDIDDGNEENEEEAEEENEQQNQEHMDQMKEQAFAGETQQEEFLRKFQDTGFNNSAELQVELTKYRESAPVKLLKFFSFFVIMLMIGISMANYFQLKQLS